MSRPTRTRAQLRRNLASRLSMPFATRVRDGYLTADNNASTTELVDADFLLFSDNFWRNQWMYAPTLDEVRRISSSAQTGTKIVFEYPLPSVIGVAFTYEMHSVFSAHEIHTAINQAIQDSYPAFFDTTEDTSLVVLEDKVSYDLTGITPSLAYVHTVWIEQPTFSLKATVASASDDGSTTTITMDEVDLSDVNANWYFSCYNGTGQGESYVIASVNDTLNQITFTGVVSFSDGDKLLLWDGENQERGMYEVKHIRTDSKEWPSKLYLYDTIHSLVGCKIHIIYSHPPTKLTSDTSTTVVPEEYVMLAALAHLYGMQVNDNRVDRQRYASLKEDAQKDAELYKIRNAFRYPDTTIWLEANQQNHYWDQSDGNPMNWR